MSGFVSGSFLVLHHAVYCCWCRMEDTYCSVDYMQQIEGSTKTEGDRHSNKPRAGESAVAHIEQCQSKNRSIEHEHNVSSDRLVLFNFEVDVG